jgi:hypothetical protein
MSSNAITIPGVQIDEKPWVDTLHEWVTTVDHKRLGVLYILYALLFLVIAGVEALIIRIQLMFPHNHFVSPEVFNRLFTMHGTTMVFFMGMPILFGFANYLVPLMIGARDMAFPRLNAFSFWLSALGAHKYPRELTWVVGVFLLLMTLGMAFTGQVMRFDQDAYWGLGIGASIASRVPIIGPAVVKLMLGGPIIAGATLSRFFALHVFVIPGMLIAFVGLHVLMVLKLGVNEWPMPGRIVRRATHEAQYHALTKSEGAPFVPYAIWKDMFFAAFIILAIAACAYYFGPFGPTGEPDPTIIQTAPKPDYFFLWLYALLSLLPPSLETPFLLIGPVLVIVGLILLPFLSGKEKRAGSAARLRLLQC